MNVQSQIIGVLTGGGDCAGLNPTIKWIVKTAMDDPMAKGRNIHYEVLGIRDGWKGLYDVDPYNDKTIENYIMRLNPDKVRTWDRYGGTMLGTSRWGPYKSRDEFTSEQSQKVIQNIRALGINSVIAIGGDGTLAVANKLSHEGVNIIGIPKTIDKDLPETDYTLGYETALNVITEEVDRLRTTAGSHKRIFVVETMGRTAGWLALEGGESCGAYIILIPECPFDMAKINELVAKGRERGNRYDIIIAAEGAKPLGGTEVVKKPGEDSFGHKALGGIGDYVAKEIEKGTKLETRSVVLSHLQRGGAPCAYDRRMGRYFGIAAIDLIVKENYGRMVCVKNGKIDSYSLDDVYKRIDKKGLNLINVAKQYDADRYNGRRTIL
jgi:6-phosphofructokinase 1